MATQHLETTGKKESKQTRTLASQILSKVLQNRQPLSVLLPGSLAAISEARERAFIKALCFGVLRHYYSLNLIIEKLLHTKLRKKDSDIKALLLIGLYQITRMRVPIHAAISATVESCTILQKNWAKNMVNAILRNYQRQQSQFSVITERNESAKYEHPKWLLSKLKNEYPQHWQSIVHENNLMPPMTLRLNALKINQSCYIKKLAAVGLHAETSALSNDAIILTHPVNVEALPNFSEGYVSVQDIAAQLAVPLLNAQAGERILDICSGPGGKLAHLLEKMPNLKEAVAVEINSGQFKKLTNTLKRLQLHATLIQDDARNPDHWWDNKLFDRIMVDIPCSASGVIRRHPDIKYLSTAGDIQKTIVLQSNILNAVWPLLKKGGKLLYITCSIFDEENDQQIAAFINKHSNARTTPIKTAWGKATKYGRQILPGEHAMDGFYYAQLQKN